jgi:hypothetical protein
MRASRHVGPSPLKVEVTRGPNRWPKLKKSDITFCGLLGSNDLGATRLAARWNTDFNYLLLLAYF